MRREHIHLGLKDVLETVGRQLIQRPGVAPLALPPEWSLVHGSLRGEPVILRTRRYTGGLWGQLVIAELSAAGALVGLTLTGQPPRESPLPILGMDLVALAGSLSLFAVDLSPVDEITWEGLAAPVLRRLHEATATALKPRSIPESLQPAFSQLAVIASAERGSESAALGALNGFIERLGTWTPLPALEGEALQLAGERRRQWREAELRNRREFDALGRMFGTEFASEYLQKLLFAPPPHS